MTPLWQSPAALLARLVRLREVAAIEVAEAHIERALAWNDEVGALLHVEPDDVRRQARALDRLLALDSRLTDLDHLARRDLRVTVLERVTSPPDKACGEGLMPSGLVQLSAMGVRERLGADDCHPLSGVRYVQEDGTRATGRLPAPGGLGIRRTALARALADAAVAAGLDALYRALRALEVPA